MPLWTFTCLCQSDSRCWKADPPSCEAEARIAHDTCLLVDKRTNSRKEVGYLDGTARKRQSKRCSSQLHKTRIRLHSWQMYRRWSIQRISTQYWMVRRRTESLRCIGFQWRHLPNQQGGKRPEFRAAIQERQRITAADPLAPPNFPKPNWQQQQQSQQQHGSRIRAQETSDSSRAGRDPMQKGTLTIVAERRQVE